MTSTDTSDIYWTLCCLCYSQKNEALVNATQQEFSTLEINLKEFIQLNALPSSIKLSRLDDGSGIAATLHSHGAVYLKSCRSYCNSRRGKRVGHSLDKQRQQPDGISPKKPQATFDPRPDKKNKWCHSWLYYFSFSRYDSCLLRKAAILDLDKSKMAATAGIQLGSLKKLVCYGHIYT